jgi:hypothetical protein
MAFRRRLILRIAAASPSRSSACDLPPAFDMSCYTLGRFDWHMACRRLASALSWRCFPAGHHELQRPCPTADPAVPSSPTNAPEVHAPPPKVGMYLVVSDREKNISDGPSGRFWRRYCTQIVLSKALCIWLSRQMLIPRIALSALLAPYRAKPCTATGFPTPTTGR